MVRLGCGAGPGGRAWEEGRVWWGWGRWQETQPSHGTASRFLSESSLHPEPAHPLSISPSCQAGVENLRASLGTSRFLEPPEHPFHPHPRQLSCVGGLGGWARRQHCAFLLGGSGAPRPGVMHTGPLGTCLIFSVEGLPLYAFK